MNKNYTHLLVVLDRSGSMARIASDMEGGLKELIREQKSQPGKCTLTFVKFDDKYEKPLDFVDIQNVDESLLKIKPRGWTALVDSLSRAIRETGQKLSEMNEQNRPGLVTVVVVTDGEENASREYTSEQLKSMVKEQINKYNWHFNYLGANQDSFKEAAKFGFKPDHVSNFTLNNSDKVFKNFARKMSSSRNAVASGCSTDEVFRLQSYTKEDELELNS